MKNLIFIVLILSLSSLYAKEPTLKETVKFLQKKLDVQSTYYHNNNDDEPHKEVQSFINNGNCSFTIEMKYEGMKEINSKDKEPYGNVKEEVIFNAKDLNPTKIVYNGASSQIIYMETREDKRLVLFKIYSYEPFQKSNCLLKNNDKNTKVTLLNDDECITEYYTSAISVKLVLTPEKENSERVIKAMKHLVNLCGGKDELF